MCQNIRCYNKNFDGISVEFLAGAFLKTNLVFSFAGVWRKSDFVKILHQPLPPVSQNQEMVKENAH